MSTYDPIEVEGIRALKDHVLVSEMNFQERMTSGGLVVVGDDMKPQGVRPRWGQVYAVGPEQQDVAVGQWVLVAHGRWTRGVKIKTPDGVEKTIRRVDTGDLLLVSDEEVFDDTFGRPL